MIFLPTRRCPLCVLRLAMVLMACVSIGMPWGVVQGIAWARMLVSYAGETSLMQAVEMTFDGEHPCELCQMARKAQNKPALPSPASEKVAIKFLATASEAPPLLLTPPSIAMAFTPFLSHYSSRGHEPEKPPPRRGEA